MKMISEEKATKLQAAMANKHPGAIGIANCRARLGITDSACTPAVLGKDARNHA